MHEIFERRETWSEQNKFEEEHKSDISIGEALVALGSKKNSEEEGTSCGHILMRGTT